MAYPCRWQIPSGVVEDLNVFQPGLPPGSSTDGSRIPVDNIVWTASGLVEPRVWDIFDISFDGTKLFGTWRPPQTTGPTFFAIQQPDGSLVIPPFNSVIASGVTDAAMSGDGMVVAGGNEWWRAGGEVKRFGDLFPRALSEDGEVLVGTSGSDDVWNYGTSAGGRAVVWAPHLGNTRPRPMTCILREFGVSTSGWTLISARACSADGTIIVGYGVNPVGVIEAWKAVVPRVPAGVDINRSGDVSVQDVFDFLAEYFAGGSSADFNGSGTLTVQDIFEFLSAYFAQPCTA